MLKPSTSWITFICFAATVGGYTCRSSAALRTYAGATGISISADGVPAFLSKAAVGGDAVGIVAAEGAAAAGQFPKKRLAGIRYEDITISFDPDSSPGFLGWMNQSLSGSRVTKNGSLSLYDIQFNEQSKLTWFQALVSQIELPELDAASKQAGDIKVTLTPVRTTRSGSGGKVQGSGLGAKQRRFLTNNFRLVIDGLDLSTVSHIDALSVRLATMSSAVGSQRVPEQKSGPMEISNLVFTISASRASTLQAWYDSFVIKGENGQDKERNGRIELLAPDQKTVLLDIGLRGLGIVRLGPDTAEADREGIARLRAEMYIESVSLTPGKG